MERIIRTEAPDWLNENWREWGKQWKKRRIENKQASFHWHRRGDELRDKLCEMTQEHCSFCDAYSLPGDIEPTIEHFKPKSKFPLEAYKWQNLFISCRYCQGKNDRFDERLLKPDEIDYEFDKYFDIDFFKGILKPNEDASEKDQERAKITIEYYGLNKNSKPQRRKKWLKHFKNSKDWPIDEAPYRFYIKRGI